MPSADTALIKTDRHPHPSEEKTVKSARSGVTRAVEKNQPGGEGTVLTGEEAERLQSRAGRPSESPRMARAG